MACLANVACHSIYFSLWTLRFLEVFVHNTHSLITMNLQPEFQINKQFASRYYFPKSGKIFIKAGTPVARLFFPAGYDFSNKLNFDRSQVKMVYDSWTQAPKSRKSRVVEFIAPNDVLLVIAAQCTESNYERNRELTRKLLASLKQAVTVSTEPRRSEVSRSAVKNTPAPVSKKVAEVVVEKPVVTEVSRSVETVEKEAVETIEATDELLVEIQSVVVTEENESITVESIPDPEAVKIQLHALTIKQLKLICSSYREELFDAESNSSPVSGYSKLRKKELVDYVATNVWSYDLTRLCRELFGITV